VLVVVALVVVLATRGSGSSHKAAPRVTHSPPTAATKAQLVALAKTLGHPLYGVPSITNATIELNRFSDGSVILRYLPAGVKVGTLNQSYLAVGTYKTPNAYALVSKASKEKQATVDHLSGGGLGVTRALVPKSVYVAYPGSTLLIEVYDPSPSFGHKLVREGRVRALNG